MGIKNCAGAGSKVADRGRLTVTLSSPMRPDDQLLRLGIEKLHAIVGAALLVIDPAEAVRRID